MELNNFLIGVFSSIVASLLVWLFVCYVHPLWQARADTESIGGTWYIYNNDESQQLAGNLEVKQTGTRVKAHLHMNSQTRDFYYSGVYFSQQLLLTFHEKGREKWIIGTFLFHHSTDGTMTGRTLFWHHDKNEFRSHEYLAKRDKEIRIKTTIGG